MRIVLDTNVLVSAVLKKSSSPSLVLGLAQRDYTMLKSCESDKELRRVLLKPYIQKIVDPSTTALIEAALQASELIAITRRITACRDPMDDKFLELAVNGNANVIISGDKDLLSMAEFQGVPIISPAMFRRALHVQT